MLSGGLVWAVSIVYGLMMMSARVKIGAHFATDTTVSSSLTWAVALVLWQRLSTGDYTPRSASAADQTLLIPDAQHAASESGEDSHAAASASEEGNVQ